MGKLKALKLGIVKGVQHTFSSVTNHVPTDIIDYTVSRMKCTSCGHRSRAHTQRRSLYESMPAEELFKLLKETQNKQTGGMNECKFYLCNECDNRPLCDDCFACNHNGCIFHEPLESNE